MLVRSVIVTAAVAIAVVATPPEPPEEDMDLPISPSTSEFQQAPVVIVSQDGAITYHGEAVADLAALDAVLAANVPDPDPAKRVAIVQGDPETDASRVAAISRRIKDAG